MGSYYYHLTLRPPSIGTHPQGGEIVLVNDRRIEIDGVENWGAVCYDRPLTFEELERFDMVPADECERYLYRALLFGGVEKVRALLAGMTSSEEKG